MTKITPHRKENGTELKRCSKCKEWKVLGEYHIDKSKKDGLRTICKVCREVNDLQYRRKHKEQIAQRMKKYYNSNTSTIKKKRKEYYEENKKSVNENKRKRYREDIEYAEQRRKCQRQHIKHLKKNEPDKYRAVQNRKNEWSKRKARKDPCYRMSRCISSGVRNSLKKAKLKKNNGSFKYISCSPSFLLERLEKMRIERGLNEDYHVDHMKPLASFDLSDPEELRRAWHFSNLQSLSPEDNLAKADKIIYDMKWTGDEWVIRTKEGNGLYRPTALFRSLLLV